ncbi:thioesterase domain protein [Rhizodiscina lignyota]|uniref:Thioesterase domain protein n=1 Tax=Rhizodiscina lignyota TaxID=1504668 RepID=A0A9P4IKQ3_9PEZI|nr:thioesterase domain protein [Rhizodiscina lignyota]
MTSPSPIALYEGEILETIENAPTLLYFIRGSDANKPLVVFIPGAYHLGRIGYGGHQNCKSSDFLAHWFQKSGYNFLAVSYPLECSPPVMPTTRPDFAVREWGAQAAEATRQTIEQKGLSNKRVVLMFWSMAGKILHPYALEARSRGLNLELAVSLVATPALRGVRERAPNTVASASGYAFSVTYKPLFLGQLHEQNSINDGREIIPDDIYVREYMGYFPISMGAFGLRYSKQEDKLVEDRDIGFEVADEVGPADLPFLGAIVGDSPLDFRHSVADKATWGFIMTYQLMAAVDKLLPLPLPDANLKLSAEELRSLAAREKTLWMSKNRDKAEKIMKVIQETVDSLIFVVHGNHHLFIGERGAKQTMESTMELLARIEHFKANLATILAV